MKLLRPRVRCFRSWLLLAACAVTALGAVAGARGEPPASASTQPAGPSAEEILNRMLRQENAAGGKILPPTTAPASRAAGGADESVAPGASVERVLREGDSIINRTGRIQRTSDGQQWEFVFESDGRTLRDPPLIILPNLKLMAMEDAVTSSHRDLKFRVTGEITEYRGRNYILLQKVVVVPDVVQQF